MGMQINTNIAALNAYRNLSATQNDLSKSLEKLSSGLRINRAADDAAGLAISEGLRAQVNGLTVAARNAQDGISLIQTAEGSLTEVHSILQRMRDLAVQAGNDSNSAKARQAISGEAKLLVAELDRIAESTNFNGIQLLDGSEASLSFQVGADSGPSSQIQVDLSTADVSTVAAALSVDSQAAEIVVADATLVTGAQAFNIDNTDGSTTTVDVTLGAAGDYATVQDVADALNGQSSFSGSLVATVNESNDLVITALDGGTVYGGAGAGVHAAAGTGLAASTTAAAGLIDFADAAGAAAAVSVIDTQITNVSTARADLGAVQNRFESAINSLNVSKENLSAAESRIRDTDMAAEMVNYTRSNILAQAGTAMLAQANTSNQSVLQLLG